MVQLLLGPVDGLKSQNSKARIKHSVGRVLKESETPYLRLNQETLQNFRKVIHSIERRSSYPGGFEATKVFAGSRG